MNKLVDSFKVVTGSLAERVKGICPESTKKVNTAFGGTSSFAHYLIKNSSLSSKLINVLKQGETISVNDNGGNYDTYNEMYELLTEKDEKAGITIKKIDGEYYYDYTAVIDKELYKSMTEWESFKIPTYNEYVFQKLAISPLLEPNVAEYLGITAHSLLIFKDKVNHGAEWDIKVDESWTTKFDEIDLMPIDPINDEFVWRDEVVNREELGNITYGYLGSAVGINETIIYMGGGYAKKII